MAIVWYPGHMKAAMKELELLVRKIDVIVEVLDARLPLSSSNHLLAKLRGVKPCIKVLNKNDLADPAATKAWVRELEREQAIRALPLSAKKQADMKKLTDLCKKLAPNRAKPGKPVRALVVGVPNVGKSTLINTLAGRAVAKVGDKPAVTVATQVIDLRNGIVLHDTPGVLWPYMKNQKAAYRLAVTGAIGAAALDYADVALYAMDIMLRRYPKALIERYGISPDDEAGGSLLDAVARRLGCLAPGGEVDTNRAGEAFLRELRAGKLGRITLDLPDEPDAADEADEVEPEESQEDV